MVSFLETLMDSCSKKQQHILQGKTVPIFQQILYLNALKSSNWNNCDHNFPTSAELVHAHKALTCLKSSPFKLLLKMSPENVENQQMQEGY